VGSRIDYEFPTEPNIVEIPGAQQVRQIAILIKPRRESGLALAPSLGNSSPSDNR
jgi:hypothetical protein